MTLAEELKSRNFSESMNEAFPRETSFADSFMLQVYTDNGQCNVFSLVFASFLEANTQIEGEDVCANGICCISSFRVHSWGEWHLSVGRPARRSMLMEQWTVLFGNGLIKIDSQY